MAFEGRFGFYIGLDSKRQIASVYPGTVVSVIIGMSATTPAWAVSRPGLYGVMQHLLMGCQKISLSWVSEAWNRIFQAESLEFFHTC